MCPPENIGKFNSSILQDYLRTYYQPSRMVIAGVNVDHQHLIDLTNEYFFKKSPVWHREGETTGSPDRSIAQYTGGIIKVLLILCAGSLFYSLQYTKEREGGVDKTIEFMFAGINKFWARLRVILARAVRQGLN